MLPSPEDLADLAVPAVGGREVVAAEVDEVMREEVTVLDLLVVDMDVEEVGTGDSEGEGVEEVAETGELQEEFLEECEEVVVEVVEVVRVRLLRSNSQRPLISGYLRLYSFLVCSMCGSSLVCKLCHFLPQVIIIEINFLGPNKRCVERLFSVIKYSARPRVTVWVRL